MPSRRNDNEPDLSGLDSFVFVPSPDRAPVTASDVLNRVTANQNRFNEFDDFLARRNIEETFRFDAPSIRTTGNGDDIEVSISTTDLSILLTIAADADGSDTRLTITRLAMDPAEFAELGAPADPSVEGDFDLAGLLDTMIGFEPYDPFAGVFGSNDRSFNEGYLFGAYDFFDLTIDYSSLRFDSDYGLLGGGGRFYEYYSDYDGVDYINLEIG